MSMHAYGDDSDTAVIDRPRSKKKPKPKPPGRQPPYAVIVLNDDDHTHDYVIALLQKVFGYDLEKCAKYADQIHTEGRAVVWAGWKEVAELKRDLIKNGGTDFWAKKPVTYPLGCHIEPLPQ